MNQIGVDSVLIDARQALLDALKALDTHRGAVVVIGAQAIYLRTSKARVALGETTKDSDLAIDPRVLADRPRLEDAMCVAVPVRQEIRSTRCVENGRWSTR